MAASLITVVAQARSVAPDSGRHLHPGEIAKVPASERLEQQIAEGELVVVEVPEKTDKSAPSRQTQEA